MANVKDLLVNGSARVIGTIYGNATSANKVNHSLTFGSKSFNGSSAQTITLADLGGKPTQSAVSSPSASGTAISFIDTISQNANGVITATKKTVRDASASQSGVVNTGTQTFAGIKTFTDPVRIGSDSNGRGKNYIAFYGTSGDNAGSFNHTYIGENLWGSSESSELVLFKGNDIGADATTVSSSGPDRIRHIAGAHLFQTYASALSGTFSDICTSTTPTNIFAINNTNTKHYVDALPATNNTRTLGSASLRWKALLVGTADSYGSATRPIYWNAGVPTICNSTLDINASGYATYLPNRYDGGDRPNPQQYFGQNIGFRIAMTRYAALTNDVTAWHDTMWVNGYNGSDVKDNTAISLIKNGTPRAFLSAQAYDAGSYGKYYEVLSGYNIPYVYSSDIDYIPSEGKFKLTRSSSSWSSHVYSKDGYNDGVSVSYKIDQTSAYIMVGLNSDPAADASYSSLDYCWYTQSGGGLCMYENGSSINSITGHTTYNAGDTFKIEYSGGYIKYYHNGVLCRTVSRYKNTSKLYMDSSFHNSGSISELKVTPISNLTLTNFSSNTDISNYNIVNTPSYIATVGLTGGSPATSTKPSGIDNAFGILHAHLHSGNYSMQLGFGGTTNRLYYRNAYATTTWTPWQTLHDSHHSIIPSSDLSYDIGSTGNKFNNAYLYTLHLRGASSATMTNGTAPANPKIIFSENGGQQVGVVYTDHDAYRASKGLKIMSTDGDDNGNVWLEVQGSIYTGGTISLNGQNANRLAWTDGNKILQAGYHYASSDRIAINSTSAPGSNLYVNGTSYFNGNTTHNGTDYFANGTTYYIDNSAGGNLNWLKLNRVSNHGLQVGTIRGMAVGSQAGEYIHMYERVHIGYPSGWGGAGAPSYGLSTYGGAWLATNTGVVNIGNTSNTAHKLYVNGNEYINGKTYTSLGGNKKTIKVDGDANTYYPVVIGAQTENYPSCLINITRTYSETAPDTWNTSTHKGGLTLCILWNSSRYWDGNSSGGLMRVLECSQTYSTMVGGIGNSTSGMVIWLRGGGANYHIFSQSGVHQTATIYYSDYTDAANRVFSPRTTVDNNSINSLKYLPINVDNLNGYNHNHFVKKAGDTMTGNLTAPSVYTSNWFRSTGSTGWYSETYQGGLYMTDSNFIRNYNSKALSINVASNNAWGIGGHRLAAVFKGSDHSSILLSTNSLGYGLCVNNDGNWYWGKRTTSSETSTSGDTYVLYGNTSHVSPDSTNAVDLGLSNHRWRSGHIYRDFNIYGNESTGDESHIKFNASDNSQRAIITFNGNVDNAFKSSTHLKIATSYGDIRLAPANGNVNIGDGSCSLTWRKADNGGVVGGLESGVYFSTPGRESVVFANMYAHTGWIFANGIRPSNKTNWNALGVTPAMQIHHNAVYINRPVRDADTSDYNLYVNGTSYFNGTLKFPDAQQIFFQGKGNSDSVFCKMGFMNGVPAGVVHCVNAANHQTDGAFYITSNGYNAGNDYGGIAIDNEGVTVFGAGDPGNNFTGVFRVINEDNIAAGPVFRVQKDGNAYATKLYGAVWNDYAEYRKSDITEPGRVVIENGDGTLSLSTKRLQRGAEVISDTYGFAIGETDECKTPIAATGRVLAYTYEPIEEYRSKTGWPVCSGPNGTVSIMTEEEEEKYPSRIIGTISEVPNYEEWGTGKVKTNGRVWIRIK